MSKNILSTLLVLLLPIAFLLGLVLYFPEGEVDSLTSTPPPPTYQLLSPTPTRQEPDPTPTQERCFGFDGTEEGVTQNPCLDGPNTHDTDSGVYQAVPKGHYLVQTIENIEGEVDFGSAPAPIYCDPAHCQLLIHNSVHGINGNWGFGEEVELEAGCHIIKVTGKGWINDPPRDYPNQSNYTIMFWRDGEVIGISPLPVQDPYQAVASFWVEEAGLIDYQVTFRVSWSTAGEGSWIEIFGLGVIEVEEDWCTPE